MTPILTATAAGIASLIHRMPFSKR
jgi:hypothetical protein